MEMHEVETLQEDDGQILLERCKVPGGWLYIKYAYEKNNGITVGVLMTSVFVPEPPKGGE